MSDPGHDVESTVATLLTARAHSVVVSEPDLSSVTGSAVTVVSFRSRRRNLSAVAAIVFLVAGASGAIVMSGGDDGDQGTDVRVAATPPSDVATTEVAAPPPADVCGPAVTPPLPDPAGPPDAMADVGGLESSRLRVPVGDAMSDRTGYVDRGWMVNYPAPGGGTDLVPIFEHETGDLIVACLGFGIGWIDLDEVTAAGFDYGASFEAKNGYRPGESPVTSEVVFGNVILDSPYLATIQRSAPTLERLREIGAAYVEGNWVDIGVQTDPGAPDRLAGLASVFVVLTLDDGTEVSVPYWQGDADEVDAARVQADAAVGRIRDVGQRVAALVGDDGVGRNVVVEQALFIEAGSIVDPIVGIDPTVTPQELTGATDFTGAAAALRGVASAGR